MESHPSISINGARRYRPKSSLRALWNWRRACNFQRRRWAMVRRAAAIDKVNEWRTATAGWSSSASRGYPGASAECRMRKWTVYWEAVLAASAPEGSFPHELARISGGMYGGAGVGRWDPKILGRSWKPSLHGWKCWQLSKWDTANANAWQHLSHWKADHVSRTSMNQCVECMESCHADKNVHDVSNSWRSDIWPLSRDCDKLLSFRSSMRSNLPNSQDATVWTEGSAAHFLDTRGILQVLYDGRGRPPTEKILHLIKWRCHGVSSVDINQRRTAISTKVIIESPLKLEKGL